MMVYEAQAIALGWVFNDRLGKWVHPEFRNAAVIKAKYAVEDHEQYLFQAERTRT